MLRFNGNNQQLYITDSDTRTSTLKKKLTVAVYYNVTQTLPQCVYYMIQTEPSKYHSR
jgi:hypothetical protein